MKLNASPTYIDLCERNKAIGLQVRDFILNVPNAKEESITDYLVWQWGLLDSRFRYIKVKTFTRQEENTSTGADFELELWVVGKTKFLPLLFQAKKFLKPFDSYQQKLNYPNNKQKQLATLLAYASTKGGCCPSMPSTRWVEWHARLGPYV